MLATNMCTLVLVSPSAPGRNRNRARGPAGSLHGAAWRVVFLLELSRESSGGRGRGSKGVREEGAEELSKEP